jgi:predicted MFS family arabinose efflux permease
MVVTTRAPGDPPMLLWAGVAAITVALLGGNALPLLVGAVVEGTGLDEAQASFMGGVEAGAMAMSTLLLAPRMAALSRRSLALAGALVVASAFGASVFASGFAAWTVLRGVAGVGEGCVLAAFNAAVASCVDPDRFYARVAVFASLVAAVLLAGIPYPTARWAHQGAFATVAAVAVLSMPLLLWLPGIPMPDMKRPAAGAGWGRGGRVLAVLLAVGVINVGQGAVWAFGERIGNHVQMSADSIGLTLGVATIAGISGGALAARLGTRFGRTAPVLGGLVLLGLSGAAVAASTNAAQFVGAQIAFGCTFLFATPYFMGTAAALDVQGRVAAAAGGTSLLGAAIGPVAAGSMVAWGSYPALAWLMLFVTLVAVILVWPVVRRLDACVIN